jgi:carboxyl-terminal processing protease
LVGFLVAAAVAAAALPSTLSAEPRIALVIGNSAYGGGLGALKNPASDARLVSKALKSVGFQVTTLLDADQRAMKRAISDFGEAVGQAGPSSIALFFYAGHGIQVSGTNYLVPVGATIERQGDVDLEAIEAEAVLKQLEYAGAEVSIVILDACRNNPLPRSFRSGDRGLARMDAPTGSFVAYSTAPGDVAVDGEGANSPFAAALAEEVRRPGASVEEVFRSVRRKVMSATGEKQVPWDSSSLTAPFYFAPQGQTLASAEPTQPAEPASAPATQGGQMLSAEMLMWESVKDSTRAADFEAYLKRFPNGVYSDLARVRLEEFGGTATVPAASANVGESAPAAPEEPVEVAALAAPVESAGQSSGTGSPGDEWIVDAGFKSDIEKYFKKADSNSKQLRALAIAKDGSSIGVGLYTPKVASGYFGGGDTQDGEAIVKEAALNKCGGKNKCSIAYLGARKQGDFQITFSDGGSVAEAQPAQAAVETAPEPEPEPAAETVEVAARGAGGEWVLSSSLKRDIDKYFEGVSKGGRQVRALAIAIDGSAIGVGLYTPKVASGYFGGGDVEDPNMKVSALALKKCGGEDRCKIAYIGDKKQGSFELVYQ